MSNRAYFVAWGNKPWTEDDKHEFIMRVLEIQQNTPPKRKLVLVVKEEEK
jgi:hypothetical protein